MSTKSGSDKPNRGTRQVSPKQLLVNAQQAEQITGIPYTSLRDMGLRGVLPVVKFPGTKRWYFKRSVLDQLIERSHGNPAELA